MRKYGRRGRSLVSASWAMVVETQMLPSSTTAATVAPSPLAATPACFSGAQPSPCSVHDAPKSLDVQRPPPGAVAWVPASSTAVSRWPSALIAIDAQFLARRSRPRSTRAPGRRRCRWSPRSRSPQAPRAPSRCSRSLRPADARFKAGVGGRCHRGLSAPAWSAGSSVAQVAPASAEIEPVRRWRRPSLEQGDHRQRRPNSARRCA